MIALIGSIVGFVSGCFPELMAMWRDKSDKKQELALMAQQQKAMAESARLERTYKLEAVHVEKEIAGIEADTAETIGLLQHAATPVGPGWVDSYRAAVRPTIAYTLLLSFVAVKTCLVISIMASGVSFVDAMPVAWDEWTKTLVSTMIAFYFGNRAMDKRRGVR